MLTLKIITGVVVAVLLLGALYNFNQFTTRQFGHRFFGWPPLLAGAAAGWMIFGGIALARDATANGLVLAAAGVAIALALIAFNVRRTNLVVGVGGSAVQMAVYAAVGLLGAALAVPALFLAVAAACGRAEPTIRHGHIYHETHG